MSDIVNTWRIWIVERHSTALVLAQSADGIPEPVQPSPVLFKAWYVPLYHAESDLQSAASQLSGPYTDLVAKLPSPDGPPFQVGLVFRRTGERTISYRVDSRSFGGITAVEYLAVTPGQATGWQSDIFQNKAGYFLIGSGKASNLWRIVRAEVDYANRFNFTLSPLTLPHGLPSPDFGVIKDSDVRRELEQHWSELQDCVVGSRTYGVITAAKNVAESLLYFILRECSALPGGREELGKMLPELQKILGRSDVPFGYLDYHLMHKLRILHGRTHVGGVIAAGRPLGPDLALTTVQDLVEILRSAGLVKTG